MDRDQTLCLSASTIAVKIRTPYLSLIPQASNAATIFGVTLLVVPQNCLLFGCDGPGSFRTSLHPLGILPFFLFYSQYQ